MFLIALLVQLVPILLLVQINAQPAHLAISNSTEPLVRDVLQELSPLEMLQAAVPLVK